MQTNYKKTRNKTQIYLLIVSIIISLICICVLVLRSSQRDVLITNLLDDEISYFYSASLDCIAYQDPQLNNNGLDNIFICLGKCSSDASVIKHFKKDHEFMHTLINEYILEFRNLNIDDGIYKYHPKEYYDNMISDFLVISNWLQKIKSNHSYNDITLYEFNLNVRPLLSKTFEEYMDYLR